MSLRAVVFVLLFMAVIATTAHVTLKNDSTLRLPVVFYGDCRPPAPGEAAPPACYQLPVYAVVAWSFVTGFALTAFFVALRSGQVFLGRWRDAREARVRERLERRYAQGLESLLGGRPERAEERFREVLAEQPEHVETLMSYGEMLRTRGRAREAAELHRRAADLRPGDMRPLFALAADWTAEGDLERAREALGQVIEANPRQSLTARRELRALLVNARRWEDAARVHEAIVKEASEGAEREREERVGLGIRYERAREAQARGALKEAEREYRAVLKAAPGFIPASVALGETLVAQGNGQEGVRAWRRGYEATQSPIFFARLEEHHLSREEPEVIIGLMRSLVEGSRSRDVPAFYLAKLYLRLEMIDEAESTLASIQGEAAESPLVRHLAATVLERRGRLKEAAGAYRRVISEARLLRPKYRCRACTSPLDEAFSRCPRCGEWSSVDVDLRELVPEPGAGSAPPPEWAAGA